MNLTVKVFKILSLLWVWLLATSDLSAQAVENEILQATSFSTVITSSNSTTTVQHPSNGSLSKVPVGSNSWEFTYLPDSLFTGRDTFVVESYSGNPPFWDLIYHMHIITVSSSILIPGHDYIAIQENSTDVFINVLVNDSSTHAPLTITGIPIVNQGSSYLDSNKLYFTPISNYSGMAYMKYTVCDTEGRCESGNISICVIDSANIALVDTIQLVTVENKPESVLLPSDGFILIDTADNGYTTFLSGDVLQYTPFQGYSGNDQIVLIKDSISRTVLITIIDLPDLNNFVVNDHVFVAINDTVEFDVFENDVTDNFSIYTHSFPDGSLEHLSGGKFRYIPLPDYEGSENFTYTVCPIGNSGCETGVVNIYIGNLMPENGSSYKLVTPKNRPIVINYNVPISNFSFEIDQSPLNGTIDSYPGLDTLQIGCEDIRGYNMVLYTPDSDFVGVDEFDLKYCVGNEGHCDIVKVTVDVVDIVIDSICICVSDCVWPGDANSDGLVDLKDLLCLGWNIGETGYSRQYADGQQWIGQYCEDWDDNRANGQTDLKHADADGDGVVSAFDTASLSEFYYKVHSIIPQETYDYKEFPVDLVIANSAPVEIGDLLMLDVMIGSVSYPAQEMHGFILSLDVPASLIDSASAGVLFYNDSWIKMNSASLNLFKQPWEGRLDAGITRTSGLTISGFGFIEQLSFVIEEELDGLKTDDEFEFTVTLQNMYYQNALGTFVPIPPIEKIITVKRGDLHRSLIEDDLVLYPNPTNGDAVKLHLNGLNHIQNVEVFDLSGKLRFQFSGINEKSLEFDVHRLEAGLYFVRTVTDKGTLIKKFELIR